MCFTHYAHSEEVLKKKNNNLMKMKQKVSQKPKVKQHHQDQKNLMAIKVPPFQGKRKTLT